MEVAEAEAEVERGRGRSRGTGKGKGRERERQRQRQREAKADTEAKAERGKGRGRGRETHLVTGALQIAHHGVSLPRPSLPIRKQAGVVARQDVVQHLGTHRAVDVRL